MARHDQRPDRSLMTCTNCKAGDCGACVDVLRMVYTNKTICKCTRKNHTGEPVEQQIQDPFDGTVHGPAVTISKDGIVTVDQEFKRSWMEQFDE